MSNAIFLDSYPYYMKRSIPDMTATITANIVYQINYWNFIFFSLDIEHTMAITNRNTKATKTRKKVIIIIIKLRKKEME